MPDESYIQRVLRESRLRRQELVESVNGVLEEIVQIEDIMVALGEEPEPLDDLLARPRGEWQRPEPEPQEPEPEEMPEEEVRPTPQRERPSGLAPQPKGKKKPVRQVSAERLEMVRQAIRDGKHSNMEICEATGLLQGRVSDATSWMHAEGEVYSPDPPHARGRRWFLAEDEQPEVPPPGDEPEDEPARKPSDPEPPTRSQLLAFIKSQGKVTAPEIRVAFKVKALNGVLVDAEEDKLVERYKYHGKTWFRLTEKGLAETEKGLAEEVPAGTPEPPAGKPRTVTHAGAEAVPEHLRGMPAAHGNIAPKQRLAPAQTQLEIYQLLRERGPMLSNEIADARGDRNDRNLVGTISRHLRSMEEFGIVRKTGRTGHAPWQKEEMERTGKAAGRPSIEYEALPLGGAKEPDPDGGFDDGPGGQQTHSFVGDELLGPQDTAETVEPGMVPTMEQVRNVATKLEGMFGVARILTHAGEKAEEKWDHALVEKHLQDLEEQGVLKEVIDGQFEYQKPTAPGKAAQHDRESSRHVAAASGAMPVPGTGKQQEPTDPEIKALVREARAHGSTAKIAGNSHWEIKSPTGARLLISSTPRSSRTVQNDRTRMRKAGAIK